MKNYTINEIVAECRNHWEGCVDIDVRIMENYVDIDISDMYAAPGLSFAHLQALAKFFDTQHIDDVDTIGQRGCETCDYGSKYGFTLRVSPETTA